jgi:hypothetical protein
MDENHDVLEVAIKTIKAVGASNLYHQITYGEKQLIVWMLIAIGV